MAHGLKWYFCDIDRELDFDVFNILKVDLITKAALDTNMNTKVSVVTYAVEGVCLSVLQHDISKTSTARVTKLNIRNESWKGQGHNSHKRCCHGSLNSCECWLLLASIVNGKYQCEHHGHNE